MRYKYPVSRPSIGAVERTMVNRVLDDNQLTYGPTTLAFEAALAEYLQVKHVLACSSGTTALHLTLAALGIGPGDEVLVPDLTFVATANAVRYTGATVVLVDVDPKTWCMSTSDAERKMTERTKAVIPVHLYGVAADLRELGCVADLNQAWLVEDAAEGLGGAYRGVPLGTFGAAGTYSFYGNKVLTTGEGGAVATDDGVLAARLFLLRGQAIHPHRRYYHPEVGFNYRITDLQSAVGLGQMAHLEEMLSERAFIFQGYGERLRYYGDTPTVRPDTIQAPWLFTFLPHLHRQTRNELISVLAEQGIETRPTFVPLHRMPMYAAEDRAFPVASHIGDNGISLPTYPGLALSDVWNICAEVIKECVWKSK